MDRLQSHQKIPVVAGLVLLLGAVSTLVASEQTFAQPGSRTTLYVGGGELGVDAQTRTDIVVVLGPPNAMNAFEVVLKFDASLVVPSTVAIDAAWTPLDRGPQSTALGQLALGGFQPSRSCQPGAACHLASIEWKGLAQGDSVLDAIRVNLQDAGTAIPDVAVVAGRLRVGTPIANSSARIGSSGSISTSVVEQAHQTQNAPRSAGTSAGTFFVLLVGLAAMLVAGAVFIIAVARRSWSWASQPQKQAETAPNSAGLNSEPILATVADYLGKVEAFGRVADSDGADTFAREVVTRLGNGSPSGEADALGVKEY